jgi:hypothetical protein
VPGHPPCRSCVHPEADTALEAGAYCASGGTEAAGLEVRGDILLALESGMSVVDVSITHPSGVANGAAAATTDGAAAT